MLELWLAKTTDYYRYFWFVSFSVPSSLSFSWFHSFGEFIICFSLVVLPAFPSGATTLPASQQLTVTLEPRGLQVLLLEQHLESQQQALETNLYDTSQRRRALDQTT